jgi:hypothetical protein
LVPLHVFVEVQVFPVDTSPPLFAVLHWSLAHQLVPLQVLVSHVSVTEQELLLLQVLAVHVSVAEQESLLVHILMSHVSEVHESEKQEFDEPLQVLPLWQASTRSHVWLPWQVFVPVSHWSSEVHSSVVHTLLFWQSSLLTRFVDWSHRVHCAARAGIGTARPPISTPPPIIAFVAFWRKSRRVVLGSKVGLPVGSSCELSSLIFYLCVFLLFVFALCEPQRSGCSPHRRAGPPQRGVKFLGGIFAPRVRSRKVTKVTPGSV